ncbi:MAG: GntR family transcriptional regulator, partial [Planctomycetota bacterium]
MGKSSQPKYIQLRDRILKEIDGLRAGDRLMPIREMMARFGTSQGTLERAISSLEREGLVERRRGSGIYVTDRSGRTPTKLIGLAVPSLTTDYATLLIKGVEERLAEQGYRVVLRSGDRDLQAQETAESFRSQVDGMIVSSRTHNIYQPSYSEFFSRLNATDDLPLVMIDIPLPGIRGDFIGLEYYRAFRELGRLLEEGKRSKDLVFLALEDSITGIECTHGFYQGLVDGGRETMGYTILRANLGTVSDLLREVLQEKRVSTLVNTDPRFLPKIEKLLLKKKVRVPDRMVLASVVEEGYDEHCSLPLLALQKPSAALGALAAETLTRRLDRHKAPPVQKLPLELIIPQELK